MLRWVGGGEFDAIARLQAQAPSAPEGETWIGDDAAVVRPPLSNLLLACDAVVEGVHADLSLVSLADLGWKALAVNLSDIAAMGGRPLHALCALGAPPDTNIDEFFGGLLEAASAYGCALVGGDLTNSPNVVAAVTVTGTTDVAPVMRGGARVGDSVFVTGPLGSSAAGLELLRRLVEKAQDLESALAGEYDQDGGVLRSLVSSYRRPLPRLAEGQAAAAGGASAMIDVSDGLIADLGHVASVSRLGIELSSVPIATGSSMEEALGGGEDYELAFTAADRTRVLDVFAAADLREPLVVGECVAGSGVRLDGRLLPAMGWQHTWGASGGDTPS